MPREFWAEDALRQAFAARHIGRVLRAYRRHPWHGKPLSQERVAGWLRLSQAQLSRIESGPPIQDLTRLIAWARLFGMPSRDLWFALPNENGAPDLDHFPTTVGNHGPVSWTAMAMDDLPPRMWDRTASIVGTLRRQLDESKAADGRLGPTAALPGVLDVLGAVQYNVRDVKPRVRRALLTVGADAAEFLGWLYRDLRDLRTAEYWYDRATELAQEAGDDPMQGYILIRKSQLAYDRRDALRVLTLAEAAQRSGLPVRVQAESAQQEALGLAMLGEPLHVVERKLDDAHYLLTRATDTGEPNELGDLFNEGTLLLRSTACYTEAGKPARAAKILGGIIATGGLSSRDAGYFQARRAAALALTGEPDEAAMVGLKAAQIAHETCSRRTWTVLMDTMRVLSRWNTRPLVRSLCVALTEERNP
ncbi:helix-turn-helix domain-containing protein [Spongiactinospora sp. 9N601]|uniref:helix-turn-helix domain-containing protein n=1 Tax=Spongiactinospora sp. 9N601 TaxID=3375149 RepID=UPI0037B978D8